MTHEEAQSPLHGYRGIETPPPPWERPVGLTIAISREAGARGSSIAAAVGAELGRDVYPQEMLDFLTHDDTARAEVLKNLPDAAIQWASLQAAQFQHRRKLSPEHDASAAARLIFALAARGACVLVGRGAGFILPQETTLHVRIVSPLEQRTGYLAQWLRLTETEALAEAHNRDKQRASFLRTVTDVAWNEPSAFDLTLNSSRLSMAAMLELIATAARVKEQALQQAENEEPTEDE